MAEIVFQIFGRVQGVGFRAAAKTAAARLDLRLQAQNEPDGSLTIRVAGARAPLEEFAVWCRVGPPGAAVERVERRE